MAEVIVFPDVEDAVRTHLSAALNVPTHVGSYPAALPGEFLFVRRTGGPARDLVTDLAQVTVEAYAKRGARAHELAALARAYLGAAAREGRIGDVTVYEVNDFSGPYLDPDPDAPTHTRYSATYQVAVRGTTAA